jgi:hypothetical protein
MTVSETKYDCIARIKNNRWTQRMDDHNAIARVKLDRGLVNESEPSARPSATSQFS